MLKISVDAIILTMTQLPPIFIGIYFAMFHFGFSDLFMEVREIKCVMSRPGMTEERVQGSALISKDNFTSITTGEPPSSTDHMPGKPKDPIIVLDLNDNIANISWLSPTNGWKHVGQFLVKIEENIETEIRYRYILVNVSGGMRSTSKFTCLYHLPNGSEKMTVTVWALDLIRFTSNGHMTADVDEYSKSDSVSKNTDREREQKRIETEKCKCSDLLVSVTSYPSCLGYTVKGESLPLKTKVRIELLRKSIAKMKGDHIKKTVTAVMSDNNELKGKFKIKKPGHYYIRVDRLCQDYHVICNHSFKKHADVIRSETVHVILRDNSEHPVLISKTSKHSEVLPNHSTFYTGMVSSRMKSKSEDGNQIIKLTIVIFVFGLAAILQLAVIFKWCSDTLHPLDISKRIYKYPTCITVGNSGRVTTKVHKPKRVAIIFTKDSTDHISRVYQLKSFLRRLGIDVTLYDEYNIPEMRYNWIQVGETIAIESDVVLFVMSWHLITMCQPQSGTLKELSPNRKTEYQITESDNKLDRDTTEEEIETDIEALNQCPLHKLPVVVVNSLKTGRIISSRSKPRIVSVYLTTNASSVKRLMHKMHRDHPSLMADDVVLKYAVEDNEINVNHIRKLADKIKS